MRNLSWRIITSALQHLSTSCVDGMVRAGILETGAWRKQEDFISRNYPKLYSVSFFVLKYYRHLIDSNAVEGALGLTLEERALLASEARHALRLYARERSNFVARVFAEVYDGLRHLQSFGYWSSTGMNWEEVKLKYRREAIQVLGSSAPKEEIDFHVYNRILERSCATNIVLDEIAHKKMDCKDVVKVIKSFDKSSDKLIAFETIKDLKPLVVWLSLLISPFYAVGFAN